MAQSDGERRRGKRVVQVPLAAGTQALALSPADREALAGAGMNPTGEGRSGTFIMRELVPLCAAAQDDRIELLPIDLALQLYPEVRERCFFQAVPADLDEVTARCAAQEPHGYFIRVRSGARVTLPCQAALYMPSEGSTQVVHNVIVVEDDAEVQVVTGCLTGHGVETAMHLAVDEQYVGKNARLINTMVHSWGPEVVVQPRSGAVVEAGGRYESNYVSLRPPKSIHSDPQIWLRGEGASARLLTVILGSAGSIIETGGDVHLDADGTGAELVHRGVCTGGRMIQRGLLIGNAACRAHVDCAGMLVSAESGGEIESVPGLKALHPEARLSHEASIGKIAPEQVEYLQARGMDEGEAISMLIRGFLGRDVAGLGPELDARIAEIAQLAGHGEA